MPSREAWRNATEPLSPIPRGRARGPVSRGESSSSIPAVPGPGSRSRRPSFIGELVGTRRWAGGRVEAAVQPTWGGGLRFRRGPAGEEPPRPSRRAPLPPGAAGRDGRAPGAGTATARRGQLREGCDPVGCGSRSPLRLAAAVARGGPHGAGPLRELPRSALWLPEPKFPPPLWLGIFFFWGGDTFLISGVRWGISFNSRWKRIDSNKVIYSLK